jgi:hypothetical protein
MTSNNQVSPVIRISRGERDASARATHLKAASRKYLETTIERKQMSTTTTFKRIALVVSVALAFGGVSAVQAQAANTYVTCTVADGGTPAAGEACNGVAGVANTVTLSGANTAKDVLITVSGTKLLPVASSNWSIATDGLSATLAANTSSNLTIKLATAVVGSYTVSVYTATAGTGIYSATSAETVVVTVAAAASSAVYSATNSPILMASGETRTVGTTDATVSSTSASNVDTAVATIKVVNKDGLGNALSDTITATITSGPGTIGVATDTTTLNVAGATNGYAASVYSKSWRVSSVDTVNSTTTLNGVAETQTAGTLYFLVYANGQSGTSTIVFKNTAGTVLSTKTITFSSPVAATISAVVKKAYIKAGGTEAVANQKVFAVTVKDAGSVSIKTGTVTATAATGSLVGSNGACSYDSTDSVFYCSALGVATDKFGPVVYTIKHTNTTDNSSVSTTATTTFADVVATSVTIVPTPASPAPGEQVTYTLTAKEKNGYFVADGVYESTQGVTGNFGRLFASAVYSASNFTPFVVGDTVTTVSGVATSKVYLPFVAGKVTATWTLTGTAGTASGALSSALTGTSVATTISIADNASAALAAVTALATTVASLKTLIVTLTNLVLKIQKKVKA